MAGWRCVAAGSTAFLMLLLWFTVMVQWGSFPDPDGFYHAHLAMRMLEHGALREFPWLDLTTLGRHPIDQHYLYHVLLGPAVATLGALPGTQLMSVLFAAFTATALWGMVRSLAPRQHGALLASVVLALALLVPAFTFRLLLPKASALVVGLYAAVVWAMLLRRPLVLAVAGAAFALTHSGWLLPLLAAGLLVVGEIALSLCNRRPWRQAVAAAPWRPFAALVAGTIAGLALHPNRAALLSFTWVQVVEVAIARPRAVELGSEWRGPRLSRFLRQLVPLLVVLAAWLPAFLWARRHGLLRRAPSGWPPPGRSPARTGLLLALPVLATLLLNLRSQRFAEYFVPTLALWIASLWSILDLEALVARARARFARLDADTRHAWLFVAGALLVIAGGFQVHAVWKVQTRFDYPFDLYETTIASIRDRAEPGDRVFNAGYDDFPILFAGDDRLRYLWGLDPTFLYDVDPDLATRAQELVSGFRYDAVDVIARRTGSRFVFVRPARFPTLDALLSQDEHFRELARDPQSATYEVLDSRP